MMNKKHKIINETNKFIRKISKIRQQNQNLNNDPLKNSSNQNQQRLKRNLTKKLNEEAIVPIESWTLHGLPNVFRSKYKILKLIWAIIFLAALGVSIYFLVNTIKEYLEYNVTTVVRSINVDELDFPIITLCNNNGISNQKGLDYFLSILNISDLETLSNFFNMTGKDFSDYGELASALFYEIPIQNRENYTSTIDEIFLKGFLYDYKITTNDFNWIFNPFIGNCYQLNTDLKFKVKDYRDNILELHFNLSLPSIVEKYGYSNALIIFLQTKKSNIYRLYTENSILFRSGLNSNIQISKSVFNKQKKPYSECDLIEDDDGNIEYPSSFDRKYFDQIKSAGYEYSQSMCISFCQLDRIGNNCTFRASSINAPNNMDNFCPNKNLNLINSEKILTDYFNSYFYNEEIDRQCSKKCPLECRTEKYDVLITNVESDDKNFIGFTINYNSFSYLNYEESPSVSVYNLISNIGGAIGLLLGNHFLLN